VILNAKYHISSYLYINEDPGVPCGETGMHQLSLCLYIRRREDMDEACTELLRTCHSLPAAVLDLASRRLHSYVFYYCRYLLEIPM
jgi:hypothetical protein